MCMLDKIFMVTWKMKCSSSKKPQLLTEEQEHLFNEMVQNGCLTKKSVCSFDGKDIYYIDDKKIDDTYRFAF